MELNQKRVLVVGLGRSGVASALFLKSRGARVTVSDSKSEDQLREEIPRLLDQGIIVETGGHGERTFQNQDLIVVSPGVPVDAQPLEQARALGQLVIGEIELAAEFLQGSVVAITGSNGKTTTTTLTGEILAKSGLKTLVGGNISIYTELCEKAREEAFELMLQHAGQHGANAVVAMRYDANDVAEGVTEVLAYGTAVLVEPLT